MNKKNSNLFLSLMLFALATSNFGCNDKNKKKEETKKTTQQTEKKDPPSPPAGGSSAGDSTGGTTTQTPPVTPPGQLDTDASSDADSDADEQAESEDQTVPAQQNGLVSKVGGTIRKYSVQTIFTGLGLAALGKYVYSLFNPSEQTKIDTAYGKHDKMQQQVKFVEDLISDLKKHGVDQDKLKPIEEFYAKSWNKDKGDNLSVLKEAVKEKLKEVETAKKAYDEENKSKPIDAEKLKQLKAALENAKKELYPSVQEYVKESKSLSSEWSKAFNNFYKELCKSSIKENLEKYLTVTYRDFDLAIARAQGDLEDLQKMTQEEIEGYEQRTQSTHKEELEKAKLTISQHTFYEELLNTYNKNTSTLVDRANNFVKGAASSFIGQ